ncbi:IKI3-domain-containing protein [Microstroma glucosiphilum]|uniref:IKI3-domain-containing protein n=1 Tax=Pseudomicrostroma glucosiphilum TaxID=1684307 RepID=A0A316UGQ6_9BASI|nr:IKI3-domain-containing protein [Pseudomicrostroma glucosiphilum]PWN23511.1 IKI3-domain-containing protein [Pseudomicrostroma glucosiphilum]
MRDLSLIGREHRRQPSRDGSSSSLSGLAFDASSNTAYTVFHSLPTSSGFAAFHIFANQLGARSKGEPSLLIKVDLVASTSQSSSKEHGQSQVRSFAFLADGGSAVNDEPALCLITSGGDIVLIPTSTSPDAGPIEPQIVGSVEQGILAAAWSPDEEAVVLVVPSESEGSQHSRSPIEKMLVMSREFEVLDEKLIREQGRGDEQVSVGWGSKATQFQGSAGKAAASISEVGINGSQGTEPLPDDDLLPHISWRGDCAFYVISSLEHLESGQGTRRMIRTFDRSGNLTAVSDETETGLSHVASMKPIGNLYATSQRFDDGERSASATYARGRTGRHDITFFERNGLKRGGFSLREEGGAMVDGKEGGITEPPLLDKEAKERSSTPSWTRPHEIVDIKWNSDGSCLAVHLRSESTDVLQIWMVGNWHWYLKHELRPSTSSKLAPVRLRAWMWHPEQPFKLLAASSESLDAYTFSHTTCSQPLTLPTSSSGVAVTDGAVQRITFFDKQTAPPPMCGLVLPTSKTAAWRSVLDLEWLPEDVRPSEPGGWTPRHKAWAELELQTPEGSQSKVMVAILALLHPTLPLVQLWSFAFISPKALAVPKYIGQVTFDVPEDWQGMQVVVKASGGKEPVPARLDVAILATVRDEAQVIHQAFAFQPREASSDLQGLDKQQVAPVAIQGSAVLLANASRTGKEVVVIHDESGELREVFSADGDHAPPLVFIEEFCANIAIHQQHVIGMSASNKLYSATLPDIEERFELSIGSASTLARDATSFIVSEPFLIWTNTSHEARFLPLASLTNSSSLNGPGVRPASEAVSLDRRIERGARIVTAGPRQMALVLQMPRGNLERIFPRGMVLDRVRRELDRGRYKSAFLHCRSNRVDLNLLHDHNPAAFLRDVPKFIEQVNDVDHFNLFLSSLKSEDVTKVQYKPLEVNVSPQTSQVTSSNKVNEICKAFINEFTRLDDNKRYIKAILTAHVKKVPADYETALSLLRDLKDSDPALVDSAIEYIIFLAPFDSLFDVALGMYDLTLALMVAQHSKKKDPREYLPFLRDIRAVEPMQLQRFQIDDHLKRYGKALKWLAQTGGEHHERALQYLQKYRLFAEGLEVWSSDSKKWKQVQALHGDYLSERNKWVDAALCYQLAGDVAKALSAFHSAGAWQDAFTLALSEKRPASEITSLASTMASRLEATARHAEAGRVKLEYGRDVEGAVESYGKANEITECRRICSAYNRLDLIETHVKPAALKTQENLIEDIEEMSEQLSKQMVRLKELREKKEEQPSAFYGEGDGAGLDNIDVQSDTSTQITQFTRYTKAPTHAGTMSSLSATSKGGSSSTRKGEKKIKKREEKKKAVGKKGSVYEEDYLYESLGKLLGERLGGVQEEASRLLPNLIVLGPAHRQAALVVHTTLLKFEAEAAAASQALQDVAYEAGVAADEARIAALSTANALSNPTSSLLDLLAGTTWLDKAAQRKKVEVAEKKWRCEMLETTMVGSSGSA